MNLGDLFKKLSFEKLSNLSIGMSGSGDIQADKKDQVASHVNTALTALYSRFPNQTHHVRIKLDQDIERYQLHPRHNVSDEDVGNTAPRFIQDSAEAPFGGHVVKVTRIIRKDDASTTDTDETQVYSINDMAPEHLRNTTGVQMVAFDTILVRSPVHEAILEIEYQSRHVPLSIPHDATEQIVVAPLLEEAVLAKVTAAIFGGMAGEENSAKAQMELARYEQICALVQGEDLLQQTGWDSFDRLSAKGFI